MLTYDHRISRAKAAMSWRGAIKRWEGNGGSLSRVGELERDARTRYGLSQTVDVKAAMQTEGTGGGLYLSW